MNDSNSNEVYEGLINEAKSSVDTSVFKRGANLILGLGIFSLIVNIIIPILLYDTVTPLGWLIFLLFPIVLLICSVYARKGHTWAFIVPIVLYVIDGILLVASLNWWQIALRIVLLVLLGKTLRDVLAQKRIAKEEATRQNYQ